MRSPAGSVHRLARGALQAAEAFALAHAATPLLRDLLGRAFTGLNVEATQDELLHYVHLPLLLHAALTGDGAPARPLVTVTTLIYLGADAFDDVLDGEQCAPSKSAPVNQIELSAMSLWTVLPQLALSHMRTTPDTANSMRDTLTRGLQTMIEGQLADVAAAGTPFPDSEAVQATAEAKSGGELAMFARLTAELADMDREAIESCAEMGRAMGLAAQIASDCADIFQSEHSQDLATGTRTLPIALHLRGLSSDAHQRFLRLLDDARQDQEAQLAVRREMLATHCLRQCALIVEIEIQRALRHLAAVARFEQPAQTLREWIEGIAFRERTSPTARN